MLNEWFCACAQHIQLIWNFAFIWKKSIFLDQATFLAQRCAYCWLCAELFLAFRHISSPRNFFLIFSHFLYIILFYIFISPGTGKWCFYVAQAWGAVPSGEIFWGLIKATTFENSDNLARLSPQVSGITFAFDPKKPPGSRVDPEFVKVTDAHSHDNTSKIYIYIRLSPI